MSLYRAYLENAIPTDATELQLGAGEAQHLFRVRRARSSDQVQVLDGRGRVALCQPAPGANQKNPKLEVLEMQAHPPPHPRLELAVAIPKGKTMDAVVQRATELGAAAIHPLLTAQSEVQLDAARAADKRERWQQDAIESIKQCGTPWCPEVKAPSSLSAFLSGIPSTKAGAPEDHSSTLLVAAALQPDARPALRVLTEAFHRQPLPDRILFFVGPEGDFSSGEYAALRAHAARFVSLGRNVLRVETACAAILAIANAVSDATQEV